jgi:asparagine synthetase B (glutamine-hydrolysing)
MPKGSIAYTFKCVVPGVEVIDETLQAAKYAAECGLEHKIIEIYWEDFEHYAPELMKYKGAPIHSIEVQIYKAALQAKKDDCDAIIFGESADINYGGLSGLLSRDWTFGEFVDRYSYVKPYAALKEFELVTAPIEKYVKNGYVDTHEFVREFLMSEAMGSYSNACKLANIELFAPYSETYLAEQLDLQRIRAGENKYIVREAFDSEYPGWNIPVKTPMPRAVNEWLERWEGPQREEFWPHCTSNMTGDQKWLIWALERFFNILDN